MKKPYFRRRLRRMMRLDGFSQKRQLGIHDHPGNGVDGGVQRGKRTRAAGNDATRVCEKRYGKRGNRKRRDSRPSHSARRYKRLRWISPGLASALDLNRGGRQPHLHGHNAPQGPCDPSWTLTGPITLPPSRIVTAIDDPCMRPDRCAGRVVTCGPRLIVHVPSASK